MKTLVRNRFPQLVNFLRLNVRYRGLVYGVDPDGFHKSMRVWEAIQHEYGYDLSARTNSCVDADGDPIPWYTYPAIEYLAGLSFTGKDVWEYGCGNSTKWSPSLASWLSCCIGYGFTKIIGDRSPPRLEDEKEERIFC